jgi:hypothetical protein
LNDRMVYIHDSKFTKPISSSELVQTEVWCMPNNF